MMMEQLPIEYAVSLSREEYVRSQQLLSRVSGNGSRNRWLSLVTAVMFILLLGVSIKVEGAADLSMTILTVLIVAIELALFFTWPHLLRRNSEEAYDQTRYTGYSFDGTIRLTASGISKITAAGETTIRFSEGMYVEAEDMMIFCGTNARSIIVPARCVTPLQAEITRQTALQGVMATRRRLLNKMVSTRTEPFVIKYAEVAEEEAAFTIAVEYTEKEFSAMFTDGAFHSIGQTLPMKSLWAICLAMITTMWYPHAALPVFVLFMGLLILWPMIMAPSKARRAVSATEGQALRMTVIFTDSFVKLQGRGETAKHLSIPWEDITRGIERPQRIDLYAGRKLISIPKRCVEDVDALREFIDGHLPS